MGQVEVGGWSFQLSVRNLDLLLQSIQNLERSNDQRLTEAHVYSSLKHLKRCHDFI